ncbi:hypothetical protein TEA_017121 [Camellia sinensis var. sinensis]|uniref:Uncharacterized protein n=1 Tax=Camellia sinensis var. sinensis TaxID=542762 RepID=A0A4S4E7N9_CAMSN|nr:hypothetical protein TEA_017121 [Camellia sinensis var. sinensis]
MGDSFDNLGSRKNSELTSVINNNKVSKSCLVASSPKSFSQKATQHVVSFNPIRMGRGTAGDAALFLLKVAALETVRRFSRAKCPFLWHGIQVLQVLCYPPLKWIQRWAPFKGLVNNMQSLCLYQMKLYLNNNNNNNKRASLELSIFASPAGGNLTLAARRTSTYSAVISINTYSFQFAATRGDFSTYKDQPLSSLSSWVSLLLLQGHLLPHSTEYQQ